MTVGLIIVTFNASAHIARCLEAVHAQTRQPDRVVIVDNASTDDTVTVIERTAARLGLRVEVVAPCRNLGFAAANNRGVDRLDGCDAVALLNPDAFPEPQWLSALVDAANAHQDAGSFASRLMLEGAGGLLDGAGDVFHVSGIVWRHGHRQPLDSIPDALEARDVFGACAAAALYRRPDWQRVGGFDERYFCYAEDIDLGFRLQLIGRKCRYVPQAVVHHVGSASTGVGSAFAVYHGYRNLEWTFVQNMPSRLLWRYLPLHLAAIVGQAGFFLATGRGGSLLRAKAAAFLGMGEALARRRTVQSRRVAPTEAIGALLDRSSLWSRLAVRRSQQRSVPDSQRRS